ncbi:MAG: PQQ-binding-like beta-propeller repeat protein, partial [Planctomycetes bacterium]|nr:PQQ-binding-like beta-propeller repeat protein [Planctomycetota bacterium]
IGDGGSIEINNNTTPDIKIDTITPTVPADEVIDLIRETGKYPFEKMDKSIHMYPEQEVKLYIFPNKYPVTNEARLIYSVSYHKYLFAVDALTGKVLEGYPNVDHYSLDGRLSGQVFPAINTEPSQDLIPTNIQPPNIAGSCPQKYYEISTIDGSSTYTTELPCPSSDPNFSIESPTLDDLTATMHY